MSSLEPPQPLQVLHGFRLRRAVLGILLRAGRPMTTAAVAHELTIAGFTTPEHLAKSTQRLIANLLAYQHRARHVRRVGPATYELDPAWVATLSRSTRWRYSNWSRLSPRR